MEAEDDCEEGVQRGQTTLTEFFQTRFKGSTPAKQVLSSSKQAALAGAESGPGVGVQTIAQEAPHADAAVNARPAPAARNVVQSSVNARLLDRIKSARTVPEPALEEVCCHTVQEAAFSFGKVQLPRTTPTPAPRLCFDRMPGLLCCAADKAHHSAGCLSRECSAGHLSWGHTIDRDLTVPAALNVRSKSFMSVRRGPRRQALAGPPW